MCLMKWCLKNLNYLSSEDTWVPSRQDDAIRHAFMIDNKNEFSFQVVFLSGYLPCLFLTRILLDLDSFLPIFCLFTLEISWGEKMIP